MNASKEILNTAHKVKSETISRYLSGILIAGTAALFAFFKINKMETLAYLFLAATVFFTLIMTYAITKNWINKMIEKRASELFEEKIKPVKDLIWEHQNKQYDINSQNSDWINETRQQISKENSEMKKMINQEFDEKQLPMNIAIALLMHDLSTKPYNGHNKIGTRTHLDDFYDNFKTVLTEMNIPGKDNQYKEKLREDYFKTIKNIHPKLRDEAHFNI